MLEVHMKERERPGEVMVLVGESLIIVQKIERLLAACLMYSASTNPPDERLRALLARDRETMGMLLSHLRRRIEVPDDFERTLDALLRKRNLFVHNLVFCEWFDLSTAEGCDQVEAFLHGLLADCKQCIFVTLGYIIKVKESAGLPDRFDGEYLDRFVSRIVQTARPDFGGRTFEEYVEGVVRTAREVAVQLRAGADT
jgi:hypothetical protein